jgi:S-DNA-T family DNA segregation ATPase FtsK/SpoIIIE
MAPTGDGGTELDALVAAVRAAVTLNGGGAAVAPWLPPLPTQVSADRVSIGRGIVGLIDDPDAQRTLPLRWGHADGHLLIVGAAGSGVTSALVLLGTATVTCRSRCHLYVIDGRGDAVLSVLGRSPWCAGIVRLHERERLIRLITRLGNEVDRRIADPSSPRHPIVVLVDGFDIVRKSLDELETATVFAMLETIVELGAPQGVVVVCAFDRVAAIPLTVLARCAARWIFHLTDPLDASGLGVAAADVPRSQPGRIVVAASGLVAQLMVAVAPPSTAVDGAVPAPIDCLPAEISAIDLSPTESCGGDSVLPVGLRFDDGTTCAVHVPDGEHLLIIGPTRSGRSTALHRIVEAWRAAHPDGWWMVVAPRRSIFGAQNRHRSLADLVDSVPCDGNVLIAVDDAELVDDVGGMLAALAASRRPGLLIAAAGKPDSLRHIYGHWTGVVRRSRLGIVTTAANDLDGDLLCATLPRRVPIAPRPGLVWVISDGLVVLAQVAR